MPINSLSLAEKILYDSNKQIQDILPAESNYPDHRDYIYSRLSQLPSFDPPQLSEFFGKAI